MLYVRLVQLEWPFEWEISDGIYTKSCNDLQDKNYIENILIILLNNRGVGMAAKSGNRALCRECAVILEGMKV